MLKQNLKLMTHQAAGVEFALKNKGTSAFFYEVGTGKTLTALATFDCLRDLNPKLKLLIICPLSLIHGAWTREIEKFTTYRWHDLHDQKMHTPNSVEPDIYILNFEYLLTEKKLVELVDFLRTRYCCDWMCVIDESSKMKNNKAKTVERILSMRGIFKHRVIMSGTPAPNCEWEYWAQMNFLNPDILGPNFYKFKNITFALRRGNQTMPGQFVNRHMLRKAHEQGFKYEIIPKEREKMFAKMQPWCHLVKAKDCIDLPEEVDEFRMVEMTDPQKKIYKQMKEQYIAEIAEDKFAVANIVLSKLLKLRQITSGFAISDKDEAIPVTIKNPKMEELMGVVEECGDEQIIVWCQFHHEMDMVAAALSKIAGVSQLHGRVPQKQREEHLDNFLNGKNRFLVAHPASAAHGLTLVNCHISVFFSLDYSMEMYSQARGRTYRNGQKNNCVYFHILAKDTIDEDVLAIVQRKETAQDVADRYFKNGKVG